MPTAENKDEGNAGLSGNDIFYISHELRKRDSETIVGKRYADCEGRNFEGTVNADLDKSGNNIECAPLPRRVTALSRAQREKTPSEGAPLSTPMNYV